MKKALIALLMGLAGIAAAQSDGTGFILQAATPIDNFESGNAWTKWDLGEMNYVAGAGFGHSRGLQLTSVPGSEVLARRNVNLDLSNTQTFAMWVYVSEPMDYNSSALVSMSFSQDSFSSELEASTDNLRQGWNKVVFSRADFISKNGGQWGVMNQMQVRLYDMGWNTQATFDDITMGEFTRPKVIVSFDDAYDDHYNEAYQYMKTKNLQGSCYLISSKIGMPDRLTVAQCQEMYDAGWDMCNHTETHPHLNQLSEAQQELEISHCRDFLASHGWTRGNGNLHLAYPYGFYNEDSFTALANTGYLTARTTWGARQANVLDERYLLYGQVPDAPQPASELIDLLDKLVLSGGVYEVSFHMIVTSPTEATEYPRSEFRKVIDHIAQLRDQGKVDVVTKSEWYNGLTGPQLDTFTLNPGTINGLTSTTGKVTLSAPAGEGGKSVAINENFSMITAPGQVVVPQGQTSASFEISAGNVTSQKDYTITASMGMTSRTATLTVLPTVKLSYQTITPNHVVGGSTTTGTVYMVTAPVVPVQINLSSNKGSVSVPSTVTVPAGSTSASYEIVTGKVTSTSTATITALYNGTKKYASITVQPVPGVKTLGVDNGYPKGGTSITATVTLTYSNPNEPTTLTLSSSSSKAQVPATVVIPAGQTSASFTVTTSTVTSSKWVALKAKIGSSYKQVWILVKP